MNGLNSHSGVEAQLYEQLSRINARMLSDSATAADTEQLAVSEHALIQALLAVEGEPDDPDDPVFGPQYMQ